MPRCNRGNAQQMPRCDGPLGARAAMLCLSLAMSATCLDARADQRVGRVATRPASAILGDCRQLKGESLKSVVEEFNRRNVKRLVIVDPAIENVRLGGRVCLTDPDAFLAMLRPLGITAIYPARDAALGGVIQLAGPAVKQ